MATELFFLISSPVEWEWNCEEVGGGGGEGNTNPNAQMSRRQNKRGQIHWRQLHEAHVHAHAREF